MRHYLVGIVWLAGFFFSIWWPTRFIRSEKQAIEAVQVLSVLLMTAVMVLI